VVNLTVDAFVSVLPEVAAPAMPAGIVSVTLVSGRYPADGVNVAVAPETFQFPAIFGESVGNGVPGESAEENVTVIGAAPLTWRVPSTGETDSRRSGLTGAADEAEEFDLVSCLLLPASTSFSWPAEEVAANAQPATMTAAAVPAVAEINRCRNSALLAWRTPPTLPKNDTARSLRFS
jgi:hypothetical protein